MEAELEKMAIPSPVAEPRGKAWHIVEQARAKTGRNYPVLIICLVLALLLAMMASASVGAIRIPIVAIISAMAKQQSLSETQHTILLAIRLPRVVASSMVGAALAVSGLMFQGLFRNPMADPYIIGASGGAALGACIGIVFFSQLSFFGFSSTALLAFAGSVATMTIVYSLARTRGRTNGVTLLLAGFAVGTMLTNSTYLFELFAPNSTSETRIVAAWLHGTIGVPEWKQLGAASILFAASMFMAYPLMRRLNTLALGDDYAHQLGIRVEATRVFIILAASLLTAIAVSLGGLISFAGLIVPHVVRLFLGPNNIRMLPVTALVGAIFLVIADTCARTVLAPSELPVGVLMVFLGAPFFLYLLRNGKRNYTL